jgi:hypothetical protein
MKAKEKIPNPFVWRSLEMCRSDAFRTRGVNVVRLIEFLEIEHMKHGGKQNGKLKAPRRQLEAYGISSHCVTDAIHDAELRGLIDCHRGGMRVAITYGLTWLPLAGGTPATNRWRAYRDPTRKIQKSDGRTAVSPSGKSAVRSTKSDGRTAVRSAQKPSGKSAAPLKKRSYQGNLSEGAARCADGLATFSRLEP